MKHSHLVACHEQGGPDEYPGERLSGQSVQKHLVLYDGPVPRSNNGHVGYVWLLWENWCSQVNNRVILGWWIHVLQRDVHLEENINLHFRVILLNSRLNWKCMTVKQSGRLFYWCSEDECPDKHLPYRQQIAHLVRQEGWRQLCSGETL